MSEATLHEPDHTDASPRFLAAGQDLHGAYHGLGVSRVDFKVVPPDEEGVFIIENVFHAKGGPARHLHFEQDEWFMVLEGEFIIEVGEKRMRMGTGDSLFAPRRVPHVWAHVGDGPGRILIAFLPAGRMETFFRKVTGANAMPPPDPQLWTDHGMQLLGPPLSLDS